MSHYNQKAKIIFKNFYQTNHQTSSRTVQANFLAKCRRVAMHSAPASMANSIILLSLITAQLHKSERAPLLLLSWSWAGIIDS